MFKLQVTSYMLTRSHVALVSRQLSMAYHGSSKASQDHLDGLYKIPDRFGHPLTYKVIQLLEPGYRRSAPTPFLVQT